MSSENSFGNTFGESAEDSDLLIECKSPYFPEDEVEKPYIESQLGLNLLITEALSKLVNITGWRVAIIESCVSDNKNWYRPKILKESIPRFEGSPCRIYQFDGRQTKNGYRQEHHDHVAAWAAARDQGSVTGNTVGQFRNVKIESIPSIKTPGKMTEALTADLIFCDDPTGLKIQSAWARGMMNPNGRSLFELSIEAQGPHTMAFAEGKQVRRVDGIDKVREVTIVSEGAAGGRFLRPISLSESAPVNVDKSFHLIQQATEQTFDKSQLANNSFQEGPVKSPPATQLNGSGGQIIDDLNNNSKPQAPGQEDPLQSFGQDDYSQVEKAIQVGRTGNMTLALEILQKLINDKDEEDEEGEDAEDTEDGEDDDDDESDENAEQAQPGEPSGGTEAKVGMTEKTQLKKKKKFGKSGPVASTKKESNQADVKEPKKMAGSQAESQGSNMIDANVFMEAIRMFGGTMNAQQNQQVQQAQYQESQQKGYSDDDITAFARQVAQKQAAQEYKFQEAMSVLQSHNQAIEAQSQYLAEREERHHLRECASFLKQRLQESKLPASTQQLIAEEYSGRIFEAARLENTIERHRNHIVKLAESFQKANPGSGAGYGNGVVSPSMRVSMGRNTVDTLQAEFDRAFGYNPALDPTLKGSLKEAHRDIRRDDASIRRPLGLWHDNPSFRCDGVVGANPLFREDSFREAASTDAGLSALLQNSMTKSVLQRFMLLPAQYREICEVVPAANFLEHQVLVVGGLGRLPSVAESKTGTSYLTLGFPSTMQTKYTVGTYGGLIPVTRQAIINDNLQEIQEYPKRAAESAMMTLNIYVFGTLLGMYGTNSNGAINSATSYDGDLYYHANHFNTTSTALGYQSLVDMQDRMSEQRMFGNTTTLHTNISIGDSTFVVTTAINDFCAGIKPNDVIQIDAEKVVVSSVNQSNSTITITGTFAAAHTAGPDTKLVAQLSTPLQFDKQTLIVPTQLRANAHHLLASTLIPGTTTNDASALNPAYSDGSLKLMQLQSMFLGNDINNYYLVAGRPVRWAFLGGRETPEILLQDNPLVGNVFNGDLISWKVRHEYGGTLTSHLNVQAGIV
jgi:hypothetical protein